MDRENSNALSFLHFTCFNVMQFFIHLLFRHVIRRKAAYATFFYFHIFPAFEPYNVIIFTKSIIT